MNIYFILLFVGSGFFYIIKSVNLPINTNQSNLFSDLTLGEKELKIYTRYVSIYYLIIGILLILLPFIYMLIGSLIAYIVGCIFIVGSIMINNKRNALSQTSKK